MTAAFAICRSCFASRVDETGAPCAGCNGRGVTGGRALSLAPPVLPRCDDGCACPDCEDADDAPSAADLRFADMEADQDAIRSACRRGL